MYCTEDGLRCARMDVVRPVIMRFDEDLVFVGLLFGSILITGLHSMHLYDYRLTEAHRQNIECRLQVVAAGQADKAEQVCGKLVDVR